MAEGWDETGWVTNDAPCLHARTLFSGVVASEQDMRRAERAILYELKCDTHMQCAFLRSFDYTRLRISALYGQAPVGGLRASHEGLRVLLDRDGRVSVLVVDPMPLPPTVK